MNKKSIAIIGGGIAGLSAGIYGQKNGFDCTIYEMHHQPGGQLTAWERNGYWFDFCLHWLVGTDHGTYHDIWNETGAIDDQTAVINHRTFVKIEDEVFGSFHIYNNLDEWERYLIGLAPEDEHPVRKLCRMMRKSDQLDQFEDAPGLRSPFDYFRSFIKIGSFWPILLKYGKRDSKELIEDLGFTNQRLRYFFNNLFGGQDFSAIGFLMMLGWAHAKNAGYLKGGSLAMTRRMANKFRSLGGHFRFENRVKEIIVKNDVAVGIQLEDGQEIYADHIISACDGHTVLYDMLKGKYLPQEFKTAYEKWPLFTPLVMVGFGVDDPINSDTHHINYFPKEPIFIGRTKVANYSILNRSLYDPSFADLGKSVLQIQFESAWENWENLDQVAYEQEKQSIQRKVLQLIEKHYPGVQSKIEIVDIATPLTTARYTGVWKGAYEGFKPVGDLLNGLPMELEGLQNFTMIGQWLFPGGGLPPSAQ
ncbi:MAG: NAD(P)/FAD-dependent oxidoreductase, partial [Bacteroidota bacterium]